MFLLISIFVKNKVDECRDTWCFILGDRGLLFGVCDEAFSRKKEAK